MKKFLLNFKVIIRFVVSLVTSREFAFMFVLCGVISQTSHTYYLVNSISSLEGWFKAFQATLIAIFISASLLYFVAITPKLNDDGYEEDDSVKRIINAVTLFTIIEIIINIYYYTRHLIIDEKGNFHSDRILDFVFSIMISALIPWTIKLYSSQIMAKDWATEFDEKAEETNTPITENEITKLIDEKMLDVDEKITESFSKNQALFLRQFEQKLKTISLQNKMNLQ